MGLHMERNVCEISEGLQRLGTRIEVVVRTNWRELYFAADHKRAAESVVEAVAFDVQAWLPAVQHTCKVAAGLMVGTKNCL
jgi:hypothetical protein